MKKSHISILLCCVLSLSSAQQTEQKWQFSIDSNGNLKLGKYCPDCLETPIVSPVQCAVIKSPCPTSTRFNIFEGAFNQKSDTTGWKIKIIPSNYESVFDISSLIENRESAWKMQFESNSNKQLLTTTPPSKWNIISRGEQNTTANVYNIDIFSKKTPQNPKRKSCWVEVPCKK